MAETLISAGVLARENDQSFITQGPVTVGAAIIGPTVKGPVEVPTVVTSYSQYQNVFGTTLTSGSGVYTYFTSIAAYNYFNNGGESLLVARVKSGSFSSANATVYGESSTAAVTFETLAEGTLMNSSSSLNSDGSMNNGSVDNVRWEIINSNTGSGTFDLLVRRGNDNTTEKVVLETWTDLSLDPLSTNYVAKRIGDQSFTYAADGTSYYLQTVGSYPVASKYLRVSTVNSPTPNYLDNTGTAKTAFTASIPLATSGGFENATGGVMAGANFYDTIDSSNTQGVVGTDYTNMINLLSNTDDYKFNILLTPGLYNADYTSQATSIISNTQNRGDNLYVLDLVKYGQAVTDVTGQAKSRNTSYAASYWPWVQVIDPDTGTQVWVPASTVMGGVFAYNDAVSDPWFAPAGINRGGLGQVVRPERKLAQSTRDTLYTSKVNPIASFPGTGVVVYGQKTLQTRASALDRVNVRRLLIAMKSFISQIANNLVFEQNSIATRNNFLAQVNPYLEGIQQRQGLYAFKVVMDDTNNTADVIDRNQLVGQIYVQPTRTAEFIYLDFNITPTGAAFPA
jgi:phage tail sheath protein FI